MDKFPKVPGIMSINDNLFGVFGWVFKDKSGEWDFDAKDSGKVKVLIDLVKNGLTVLVGVVGADDVGDAAVVARIRRAQAL